MNEKKSFFKSAKSRHSGSAEGFIFILGIIVFIAGFIFVYPLDIPNKWEGFLKMIVAGIAGGKGVSIPVGLAFKPEWPEWLIVFVSAMQDVIAVFWFFPLIVLFKNGVIKGKFMGEIVKSAEDTVHQHKKWAKPLGVIGIGFFVWVPLTMTGPIIGSVLGLILGMDTLAIMITVTIAGVLSAICWTYLFGVMFTWASNLNKYFPLIAIFIILVLILVIRLQVIFKKKNIN